LQLRHIADTLPPAILARDFPLSEKPPVPLRVPRDEKLQPVIKVAVRSNESLEAALRRFKRQCNYSGIFRMAKARTWHEKRSDRRRRERRERLRMIQKATRKNDPNRKFRVRRRRQSAKPNRGAGAGGGSSSFDSGGGGHDGGHDGGNDGGFSRD
jgi:small subunit ribosomal protein S21